MRRVLPALALSLCAGLLSACEPRVEVPRDVGICWHMVTGDDGKPRFNRLARNINTIELCAAELEGMRLRFNQLGQRNTEVIGGYQGQFIFLEPEGVFFAQSLSGTRFPAMVRSGDGRLVIPGAMPQPAPAETQSTTAPARAPPLSSSPPASPPAK